MSGIDEPDLLNARHGREVERISVAEKANAAEAQHIGAGAAVDGLAVDVCRVRIVEYIVRFAAAQDSDFYSRWARWFLWERMNDPAPEFVR